MKVENDKFALGMINGVILYDFVWPYVVIFLLQIVLQNHYESLVTNHYYLISIILMILVSIITIVVGVIIANPRNLLKVIKKPNKDNIKEVFKYLGLMFLASFLYNFLLVIMGVDISGGNANQNNVLELIQEVPILSFISMVILAPILEELTYRYFLYGGVAKYNKKLAIVLSGFIFMCVHAVASFNADNVNMFRELILLPPYMFSGIILAISYDKSENLVVPILIHSLNNLISFVLSTI